VAIGSYLVMWRKRHPSADRPLIDYNTTLLMEPLTLVGTVLGVLMNVSFPEILSKYMQATGILMHLNFQFSCCGSGPLALNYCIQDLPKG